MDHQRWVMNPGLFEVAFEGLILNSETKVRKMPDFFGLNWDARCLLPRTNPCPVETVGEWQVRRPINPGSVGRRRPCEKYLASLKQLFPTVARVPV
jgi:hypothetical protein